MNKGGISAIVAIVLTVLLTVAGIAIIWVAIIPTLQEKIAFEDVGGLSVVVSEGYTAYDKDEEVVLIQVKQAAGDVDVEKLMLILSKDGASYSQIVIAPGPNNKKTYAFNVSEYGCDFDWVGVAPIINGKVGSIMSKTEIVKGVITDVSLDIPHFFDDCEGEDCTGGMCYAYLSLGHVGYWDFDDTDGNVDDETGVNPGVLSASGVTQDVDGEFGRAFSFDGDEGYVNIGDSPSLNLQGPLTLSVWIYPTSWGANARAKIISKGVNGNGGFTLGIRELIGEHRMALTYAIDGGWLEYSANDSVSLDKWQHVALIWNQSGDGNVTFFVDGTRFSSHNYSGEDCSAGPCYPMGNPPDSSGANLMIGRWEKNEDRNFNGSIDDVMIFDRALSDVEIETIWESDRSGDVC